jgi:periplasmic copper chaperone A
MKKSLTLLALGTALVAVPAASGHVTLNPNEVPAGSFSRFAVRVPNERPNAETTKVVVQLPEGLSFISFQPKPGWTRTVTTETLANPVTNDEGETVTERIATVTWEGGKIAPGEFDEFGLSAKVPDEAQTLVFPSTQTYSNGEQVHWIGDADADTPAPRVALAAAAEENTPTETTAAPAASSDDSEDDEGQDWLTLTLAIVGAVAGVAALAVVLFRRPRTA